MKNILFLDTETTGLPLDMNAPYTDTANWPRIVQLAWQLYRDENMINEASVIVKPDGWEIPITASNIHGITTDRAQAVGIEIDRVIRLLELQLEETDLVVCHNIAFDIPIVLAEMLRIGSTMRLKKIETFCTKEASTDICKTPKLTGYYANSKQYKWPSLDELHTFLFGNPPEGREKFHDALTDVRATARCYFEMQRRGLIEPPHTRATII